MKAFAELYSQLDASTSTTHKVEALRRYLAAVPPGDAAWAVYFLSGGKPRQVVSTAVLRQLACDTAGVDEWLFDACYQAVGDLAETIAQILPAATAADDTSLAQWVEDRLLPLREASAPEQAERIRTWWLALDPAGRFLLTKLMGGGFRVGVSKLLVQRAIAQVAGLDAKLVAQRMMGYTEAGRRPRAADWERLVNADVAASGDVGQPYPFFLAHPLAANEQDVAAHLGDVGQWQVEWKYDGIRAQLVRRQGQVWIWSRGEELVTESFPELAQLAEKLPDGTVLDGEILVFDTATNLHAPRLPAPFARLQQRLGRKTLTRKILADIPVSFMAYDLLERFGEDLREQPQHRRREALEGLADSLGGVLELSPLVTAADWSGHAALRSTARERRVEGLMLKHRSSPYGVGRRKVSPLAEPGEPLSPGEVAEGPGPLSGWLKWKIEPMTVDAVLVYAQAGHGRRASLYTDYTFAVWNRPPADAAQAEQALLAPAAKGDDERLQLVPVAKAYSGLTDEEIRQVDAVIRRTTREKFGPVRSVQPTLLFELGFEGIRASPRHKSGVALRFPRMLRLRDDKPLWQADCLASLMQLMA